MSDYLRPHNQGVEYGKNIRGLIILFGSLFGLAKLTFACGYIRDKNGDLINVHDHTGELLVDPSFYGDNPVPYNGRKHGTLIDFIKEGKRVPGLENIPDGRRRIHRHAGKNLLGSQEFDFE